VHALDGSQVLPGSSAVSFLNITAPPRKLTLNNTLTKNINLQVVVGERSYRQMELEPRAFAPATTTEVTA
jgi:hypothetical protein